MKKEELFIPIREKYDELKEALRGTDIDKIRELTLEVHAMVHPAEISGRTEKTIADYVLEYMLFGNQNAIVPREDYEEIKQEIAKILRRFKIVSLEQWYAMDEEDGCELYECLKAGVVEVFDLDDDEMGGILEEILT